MSCPKCGESVSTRLVPGIYKCLACGYTWVIDKVERWTGFFGE